MLGVGEVAYFHSDLWEACFQGVTLVGDLPVGAFEEDVEGLLLPGFELVGGVFDVYFVHVVDVADDGGTLFNGNDGEAALGHFQNAIVYDACNEVVAVFLSLAENLEVAVVEKVVGA